MSRTIPTKSAGPLSYRTHGAVHGEVSRGPSKRTEARRLKSLLRKQARINRAVQKITRGQAHAT